MMMRKVVLMVGRDEDGDWTGRRSPRRCSRRASRPPVPAGDDAVRSLPMMASSRRLDDGRQPQARFLGALLLGDVAGEAAGVDETAVLPQHAGVDEHVLDRAVLAAHPRLVVAHLLARPQPRAGCPRSRPGRRGTRRCGGRCTRRRSNRAGQLGLVRPQDGAVRPDPVQPHRGVVEEVGELPLAAANAALPIACCCSTMAA